MLVIKVSDLSILQGRSTVEFGKTWQAVDYYNFLAAGHGQAAADTWLANVQKQPEMFLNPVSTVPSNPMAGLAGPSNRINLGGTSANTNAYLVTNPISGNYTIISSDGQVYTGYGNVNTAQLPRGTTIGGQLANVQSNVGLGVGSPLGAPNQQQTNIPALKLLDIVSSLLYLLSLIPISSWHLASQVKHQLRV